MSNYWVIVPYDKKDGRGKSFDEIWRYDLKHGTVALGASSLSESSRKDIPQMSPEELEREIMSINPGWTEKKCSGKALTIWRFHHEILDGDCIIAKQGLKTILAIGNVVKRNGKISFYDVDKGFERAGNPNNPYPNFLNVSWKEKKIEYPEQVFRQMRFGLLEEVVVKEKQAIFVESIIENVKDCLNF